MILGYQKSPCDEKKVSENWEKIKWDDPKPKQNKPKQESKE